MDELEPDAEKIGFSVAHQPEGTTVISLCGELDMAGSDALGPSLEEVVGGVERRLVIEASGLRFADSSAIALWVRWAAKVPAIELRNPPALVRRVVESMGLAEKLGLV